MQEPKQKKGLRSKKDQPAESLYDVEAVKGKETRDGIKCYLIKWSGYDEETWEPVDAIVSALSPLSASFAILLIACVVFRST